jgi:hypothetical protein
MPPAPPSISVMRVIPACTANEGPVRIQYINVWFPFMYSQI